jgi:type II secretory pathway pseudopilin PulG
MAALLISLSIMAIMLSVVMPVWKQLAQREKEAELVFRGQQYVHAIGLFQRKAGPGVYPPNVDVLVQQRFLRKKYKDPITGDDFVPLSALQAPSAPGQTPADGRGQPAAGGAAVGGRGQAAAGGRGQPAAVSPSLGTPVGGNVPGGVAGVASKSKDESIRVYNGRTHYNEWEFRFVAQTQTPGRGGAPERGAPPGQQPPGFGRGRGAPGAGGNLPPPGGRGPARGGGAPPQVPGRGFGAPPAR